MVQVWDFNRSAEMRDSEGGASKRSVIEQIEKMRRLEGYFTHADCSGHREMMICSSDEPLCYQQLI